jgi:UDP-2,3-diacylglucosamine pyrophosphatase LpxH
MHDIKRLYISDVHMSAEAAVTTGAGQHPYGWFSPAAANRLGSFLQSATVAENQQLFLVGDFFDHWVCPHDVRPPTTLDLINAPHNKPVVDGLRAFAATPGKNLFYLVGNHDDAMNAAQVHQLAPQAVFMPSYNNEFPLRVSHGHENCLFNAPDPAGRRFPLGYFITRFVATAARNGNYQVGANWRTILGSASEVVALLEHKPLAECVFDAVREAAHVKLDDLVIMPDGGSREVSEIRETYKHLLGEWVEHRPGSWQSALLRECDPFYDLEVGTPHLFIAGHSHDHLCAQHASYGAYLNLGAWCGKEAHFARTWLENAGEANELLCGELFRWDSSTGVHSASTRVRIPT